MGPIVEATNLAWDGMSHSIEITFPPLAVVWLAPVQGVRDGGVRNHGDRGHGVGP